MRRIAGLSLVLFVAALGCTSPTRSPEAPLAEAEIARARWSAEGNQSYRFDFERVCFCIPEAREPVTIEVHDGAVTSVRSRRTGEAMALDGPAEWYTIEDLFRLVEEARANAVEPLVVEYHPRGYPSRIEIGSLAADAGIHYSISNVERVE